MVLVEGSVFSTAIPTPGKPGGHAAWLLGLMLFVLNGDILLRAPLFVH